MTYVVIQFERERTLKVFALPPLLSGLPPLEGEGGRACLLQAGVRLLPFSLQGRNFIPFFCVL